MGYEVIHFCVAASVATGDGERGRVHRALYRQMTERMAEVVNDPAYADFIPDVYQTGVDWSADDEATCFEADSCVGECGQCGD